MTSNDRSRSADSLLASFLADRPHATESDLRAFAAQHPTAAAELSDLLEEMQALQGLIDLGAPAIASHLRRNEIPGAVMGPNRASDAALDSSADGAPTIAEILPRQVDTASRYRVDGEVARGGMGSILRVWDHDLHRYLAMKVALAKDDGAANGAKTPLDARSLGRFLEEAQVTGQLDHPGIVPVHELGLDSDGRVYFTMKLVKGRTLKAIFDLVAEGKEGWTQTRALTVLSKVCEAMAYAHHKGVVHRDLKPANVMVGRYGEVYVMDWGLAKVAGRKDHKNVTLVPRAATVELQSTRRDWAEDSPDSPLMTMDGDVVGTPAYMPPEQALGRTEEMGPHSDVYAVGAMLYHLLAGHMPYVRGGMRLSSHHIWYLVQQGPPEPVQTLVPGAPGELVAICERAMARDLSRRYPDIGGLAADLAAYLEHRVVAAYETGAYAEAKKWVRRNRRFASALAAALLLLVSGLVTSLVFRAEAVEQGRLATERANDVMSWSASRDLEDLIAQADTLWPAHPDLIDQYDHWLARARELLEGRSEDPARGTGARRSLAEHEAKLAELRTHAYPLTAVEKQAERENHPRFRELSTKTARLTWYSRMLGLEPWPSEAAVETALAQDTWPSDAWGLNGMIWPLIDRTLPAYGDEMKAVLLARRAVAVAKDAERAGIRDTLAWALLRVGRLDEALLESQQSVEDAQPHRREEFEYYAAELEQEALRWFDAELAQRRVEHDALAAEILELNELVNERRTFTFEDSEDAWRHENLTDLVTGLGALRDPEKGLMSHSMSAFGWGFAKRRSMALELETAFAPEGEHARAWELALPGIRRTYPSLRLSVQMGLVPIGRDPDSGLWEFAHLQSGEPANRDSEGRLVLTEETGLVLVLLPGGSFRMGAQRIDSNGPNYDPYLQAGDSFLIDVELSPFFFSKYEMTQAQWLRVTGSNPSYYNPVTALSPSLLHPVEQVEWWECVTTLKRLGLVLPSEAQWEYGARGGADTPWWTGAERKSLEGAVNLADQAARRGKAPWSTIDDWPQLDDGYVAHAPVDSFRPNAFGLHNVHGNVREWCLDGYQQHQGQTADINPLYPPEESDTRVFRGGSFLDTASFARSSKRLDDKPGNAEDNLGLRPARAITP